MIKQLSTPQVRRLWEYCRKHYPEFKPDLWTYIETNPDGSLKMMGEYQHNRSWAYIDIPKEVIND